MKKLLLTGLVLLGTFAFIQAENWILNPAKSGQQLNFNGTGTFVLQSDEITVGTPAAGDNVYLKAGDNLKLNGSSVTAINLFSVGATVEVSSNSTINSLSLDNSVLTSNGTTSSRTLTINSTLNLEGDNTITIGTAPEFMFSLGKNGATGSQNAMGVTGSGTVTKTGAGIFNMAPSSDLDNKTTFTGNWVIAEGGVLAKNGGGSDKRCDFLPGTAIEVGSGTTYTIQKMNGASNFESGDLSGQTITVKNGGTLTIEPQPNNNIVLEQSIVVETAGTFNINASLTPTGTQKYPKVTIGGDLVLNPGAKYNVGYGSFAEEGELLTLNTTTIKTTITAAFPIPPLVNYGSNPMPEYTGSVTIDATFMPGVTSVDFGPLFDFAVPSSYKNDILVVAAGAAGSYTVTLPTVPLSEDGKTWILYDGEDQKVDMSQTNNSYTFALPASANTISFKWAESTLLSIKENNADKGNVLSTKYYNIKGIEVKEPSQNSGLYIQQDTYENGSVVTSKMIK